MALEVPYILFDNKSLPSKLIGLNGVGKEYIEGGRVKVNKIGRAWRGERECKLRLGNRTSLVRDR